MMSSLEDIMETIHVSSSPDTPLAAYGEDDNITKFIVEHRKMAPPVDPMAKIIKVIREPTVKAQPTFKVPTLQSERKSTLPSTLKKITTSPPTFLKPSMFHPFIEGPSTSRSTPKSPPKTLYSNEDIRGLVETCEILHPSTSCSDLMESAPKRRHSHSAESSIHQDESAESQPTPPKRTFKGESTDKYESDDIYQSGGLAIRGEYDDAFRSTKLAVKSIFDEQPGGVSSGEGKGEILAEQSSRTPKKPTVLFSEDEETEKAHHDEYFEFPPIQPLTRPSEWRPNPIPLTTTVSSAYLTEPGSQDAKTDKYDDEKDSKPSKPQVESCEDIRKTSKNRSRSPSPGCSVAQTSGGSSSKELESGSQNPQSGETQNQSNDEKISSSMKGGKNSQKGGDVLLSNSEESQPLTPVKLMKSPKEKSSKINEPSTPKMNLNRIIEDQSTKLAKPRQDTPIPLSMGPRLSNKSPDAVFKVPTGRAPRMIKVLRQIRPSLKANCHHNGVDYTS
ncbi:unnamed protein product [Hymenolepis diminuta]|uniref:Uncharacterized protein n=1 Tax=Hymenolepis diminuta TaxID=6216 RepID=A0A564Y7W9_HYMDI|nr:unnamed protein product [Hymenolepis diminuta]